MLRGARSFTFYSALPTTYGANPFLPTPSHAHRPSQTPARRTAEYNVKDAWEILLKAKTPEEIARSGVLQDARDKVNREVERCTHTAPKFSKDGRVALLRIDSGYQGEQRALWGEGGGGVSAIFWTLVSGLQVSVSMATLYSARWPPKEGWL